MQARGIILVCCIVSVFASAQGQPAERRYSRMEYIDMYSDDAVHEMHRSGVPASITLAQGILESADGNSPLARYANNHFGIKCHSGWKGGRFIQDDDKRNECFRKYRSVNQSFRDHSDFLSKRKRYAFLFELKRTDYKGWCRGLRKAGYATNPKYANLLIKIIEDNNLQRFDEIKKMKKRSVSKKKKQQITPLPVPSSKKKIKVHPNNIKYTIAVKGDSYYKIARRFEMGLWQIYKYNDLNKGDKIRDGDIIYLQPKRAKAKADYHIVKVGETVREISQKYGIAIKSIYRLNKLVVGAKLTPGDRLHLRKKRK